ncbi:hypothetical protein SAMN05444695_106112 [Rhodococcus triatomae]|uniref:Uncharacterized protein n=1 Tax=Rhodococcus triatomae TaxID=300028 RepID=A0A1G8J9C3_9NOCA|nr:hypothetical protein SAMN05444695_106112 [Rhodococcus triatomae]
MAGVIHEEPTDDLLRVTETLTAAGWPVAAEWDEPTEP